ncbi:hypothetical protein EVA_04762 [gut metagenome]|uniref:Uncharacterized protein n=1 Tax=gut metagenome TaxID=749906 RepID=J9GHX4_9ZZZZ
MAVIKGCQSSFESRVWYLIENANNITKKYPSTQHMHFDKDGKFVYGKAYDDRNIRRVTANDPLLPRLWTFEKQNNGGYKIRNANTGCNWSTYVAAGIDMPVDPNGGGEYSFECVPASYDGFNAKFAIKIGGHMINAFQGDANTLICDYGGNHMGDAGSHWFFKKVTEVPVKIGTTGWASICMPFAVTIPAEVHAYVATSANGSVLNLKEVTGSVPAKTALVITGAANSESKFQIDYNYADNLTETNLFQGTTVERIDFAEGFTYGLGANNGKAVFMKNKYMKEFQNGDTKYSTLTVPANKAYLLTKDLGVTAQAATMLQFNFGGETTGIDGVVADDAKDTIYYDLNGRRVLYPTQGVYVTNMGKKVFIR